MDKLNLSFEFQRARAILTKNRSERDKGAFPICALAHRDHSETMSQQPRRRAGAPQQEDDNHDHIRHIRSFGGA